MYRVSSVYYPGLCYTEGPEAVQVDVRVWRRDAHTLVLLQVERVPRVLGGLAQKVYHSLVEEYRMHQGNVRWLVFEQASGTIQEARFRRGFGLIETRSVGAEELAQLLTEFGARAQLAQLLGAG